MPTDVIMPQMGESIFEGTITKWLKKAGDTVQKDEPLFEISTDKVDAEIPAPETGVLSEIKVPEGETVQINTVVAVISTSGAGDRASGAMSASAPKAQSAPPQLAAPKAPQKQQPSGSEAVPQAQLAPPQVVVVMPQMGESIFEGTITKWLKKTGDTVQKDEPLFEISTDKVDAEIPSPVTGVLTEIKVGEGETVEVNTVVAVIGGSTSGATDRASGGTSGAGNRASGAKAQEQSSAQSNVSPSAYSASGAPQAQSAPPQVDGRRIRSSPLVRRIAKENNIDLRRVPGTGSDARITKEDILSFLSNPKAAKPQLAPSQVAQLAAQQVVPLTKMRAIIAQRMVESKRISPHVHSVYRIDMTRIVRLREREKSAFEQRNGVKLTYMPFIAVAAVEALRRFPIVNASLIDNAIHYHANIHLGIAVALEWGLIVPVVREAEQRNFVSVARAINDLAGRARVKKLSPDEVGGSTFTLTNSGIFGDEFGTPIINQPESAILAIGALRKEPVVLTDNEGNDTIAIRSMQHFCLGFDHRLIDGADAGKFMSEFKSTLENWDRVIG
jgi:pyruvate dehydrogenase E2 component (dihydrolipoamide acetyltransferase)